MKTFRRFLRSIPLAYRPTTVRYPKRKAPPVGWAFDVIVVALFLVLGIAQALV
jgi:hypothetical protein